VNRKCIIFPRPLRDTPELGAVALLPPPPQVVVRFPPALISAGAIAIFWLRVGRFFPISSFLLPSTACRAGASFWVVFFRRGWTGITLNQPAFTSPSILPACSRRGVPNALSECPKSRCSFGGPSVKKIPFTFQPLFFSRLPAAIWGGFFPK